MASIPTKSAHRGEIWDVDLDPVRGHEQGGRRPALILSVDPFNLGPAGQVIAAPLTRREKGVPFHVRVTPPEGGLTSISYLKCEDVRAVSVDRLGRRWGVVTARTLAEAEARLRLLLGL